MMAGQHQTEVQRLGEELREQGAQFRQAQAEVQQLQALLSVARHDVERLRKQASSRANEVCPFSPVRNICGILTALCGWHLMCGCAASHSLMSPFEGLCAS